MCVGVHVGVCVRVTLGGLCYFQGLPRTLYPNHWDNGNRDPPPYCGLVYFRGGGTGTIPLIPMLGWGDTDRDLPLLSSYGVGSIDRAHPIVVGGHTEFPPPPVVGAQKPPHCHQLWGRGHK